MKGIYERRQKRVSCEDIKSKVATVRDSADLLLMLGLEIGKASTRRYLGGRHQHVAKSRAHNNGNDIHHYWANL